MARTLMLRVAAYFAAALVVGLGVGAALHGRTIRAADAEATRQAANDEDEHRISELGQKELERARQTFPYQIRLPAVSTDYRFLNAAASVDTAHDVGEVSSLDVWYGLPSGERLHVWQSNNPILGAEGKDPNTDGDRVVIAGRTWAAKTFDGFRQFATFFAEDGVTLTVDLPESQDPSPILESLSR